MSASRIGFALGKIRPLIAFQNINTVDLKPNSKSNMKLEVISPYDDLFHDPTGINGHSNV